MYDSALIDCDGRVVWTSSELLTERGVVGRYAWDVIDRCYSGLARRAVTSAMAGESSAVEVMGHVDFEPAPFRIRCRRVGLNGVAVVATFAALPEAFPMLSPREREVLRLLSGCTTRRIARVLGISASTVETHRQHLRSKLRLSGHDLIRLAVRYAGL